MEKIAEMPKDAKFEVTISNTFTLSRDEYLLYRISKKAFEDKREDILMKNVSFEEYVMRMFIFGIGATIAESLDAQRPGHA